VAVLVAVLGTATRTASDFHSAWLISVVGGVMSGLALAAIGRPTAKSRSANAIADLPMAEEALAEISLAEPPLADASLVAESAA
jgi:hypothetical protein